MEIPKELNNEIWEYCRSNNITNIDEFMLKLLKQGFTTEKFGATPVTKIVEKIIEKTIEVPVEKEVYITDNSQMEVLTKEIQRLEKLNEINKMVRDSSFKEMEELMEKYKQLETELVEIKNKKDIYGEG